MYFQKIYHHIPFEFQSTPILICAFLNHLPPISPYSSNSLIVQSPLNNHLSSEIAVSDYYSHVSLCILWQSDIVKATYFMLKIIFVPSLFGLNLHEITK